jgi:hypothetical protein
MNIAATISESALTWITRVEKMSALALNGKDGLAAHFRDMDNPNLLSAAESRMSHAIMRACL